jgi:integrase/recombinase XerC
VPKPLSAIATIPYQELGAIGDYLMDCSAAGLQPRTILLKHERLTAMSNRLGPLLEVGEDDIRSWWRGLHRRSLSGRTRAVYLSHARAFYAWAITEGLIEHDPTRKLRSPKQRQSTPRDLDPRAVQDLLTRVEDPAKIMIRLMLHAGLRCAEVAAVHPDRDLVRRGERYVLIVHGKGGNTRAVHLPAELALELAAARGGWLLPGPDARSHVSADTVSRRVSAALRAGGVEGTAHRLRHTYATALYERTRSSLVVQQQLGHRSLATTQTYVQAAGHGAETVIDTLYRTRKGTPRCAPSTASPAPAAPGMPAPPPPVEP